MFLRPSSDLNGNFKHKGPGICSLARATPLRDLMIRQAGKCELGTAFPSVRAGYWDLQPRTRSCYMYSKVKPKHLQLPHMGSFLNETKTKEERRKRRKEGRKQRERKGRQDCF